MYFEMRRWLGVLVFCLPLLGEKSSFSVDTAGRATAYMEWILDVSFSETQRARYQEILAELWNSGSKDAILAMARGQEVLSGVDEGKRTQMRAEKQPDFLRLLEGASDDKSRWLMSIYRDAHTGGQLTGRWTDGHISAIQYQQAVTGVSAPTNGRMFAYEFKPDGTYSFTGLMQNVLYNCTTALFSNETGTYQVEGGRLSLRPQKNPFRMTNSCAPSSNREGPGKITPRSFEYRTYNEGNRKYLELRGEDGAVQKFGN